MSELSGTYLGMQKGEHSDFWRVKRDDGKKDAMLLILPETELTEDEHYTFTGKWNKETWVFETEVVEGTKETAEPKETTGELSSNGEQASYTLSYAVRLAEAGKIETAHILSYAKVFQMYVDGKLSIKDDDISRQAMQHVKGE